MIASAAVAKVRVAFAIFPGDKAVNMLLYEEIYKVDALTLSEVLITPLIFKVFKLEQFENIFVQLIFEPHEDKFIPSTATSEEQP